MPENILVVEYEPRYTDRVKQALAGQPFVPSFARDGEEAIRALEGASPSLIVVSSVVPKISTAELIRAIRGRKPLADTPILLTVSGYNGKSPKSDAVRLGASDILPKPYSETEFLGKVQQLLGHDREATMRTWVPELDPGFTVRANPAADGSDSGQLTSNDIFGELLDDKAAAQPGARKMKPTDDLDKLLEDTLSGVRPQKKRDTVSTPAPAPAAPAPAPAPAAAKPRSSTASADLDKLLSDTLSGIDRTVRAKPAAAPAPAAPAVPQPRPQTPPPSPAAAAPQPATTQKIPTITPEKVKVSTPVFTPPAPAPKEEEEPADGIRFGQYVLIEKIATGGMAEVWKARMRGVEGFQKIVAIKKILPHLSDNQDFIEMFVDEAKLAAQLNHNNIIHIYDLGKIQNSYYIAMEYIDGHDLKTILRRGTERDQPMTVELALFIASKIAAALDYAHRKRDFEDREMGLVHRDVSPQNVLISQEGDIKLCDFGIAKAASKASHTQVGALKGKLQYMSPEQASGQKVDRRSDIFALAAVLFEMLTNRKLFQGDNELSILEQVREARVKPPSELNDEVTPEIDAIVLKALQKDPASRYQTAGEMAKELDAVLYTFKPTPTSADLAIYMHRIWIAEAPHVVVHEPEPVAEAKPAVVAPVPVPVAAPAPAPAPATSAPMFGYEEPAAGKKFPLVPVVIAAVVVVAIVAIWLATRSSGTKTAAPVTTPAAKTSTSPAATPATTSAATATAAAPTTTAAGTTTSLDQAKIDEEVKKRLAAEKAKLDAQAKAQQTTTQAAATPPRPAPATQQQPVPQPQVAEQRPPTPAPVTPAPQPTAAPVQPQPVAQQQPAPQPAVAETTKAKTGDLVQLGTEGLTPPKTLRRADPIYPQIARIERIEGLVIISALINENGQVIDTKLIRSVPRGGLNEAAEQSVRRSTFAPATKDGVRVKSWITITVNFKL